MSVRLACAIRYFAGSCPYDMMAIYGISYIEVMTSVWTVVETFNKFEEFHIQYPSEPPSFYSATTNQVDQIDQTKHTTVITQNSLLTTGTTDTNRSLDTNDNYNSLPALRLASTISQPRWPSLLNHSSSVKECQGF